jgi:hypothetical protein
MYDWRKRGEGEAEHIVHSAECIDYGERRVRREASALPKLELSVNQTNGLNSALCPMPYELLCTMYSALCTNMGP